MLSTVPFEVPKAQIAAALERGRKRTAVTGADTEAAPSIALAIMV